MKKILYYISALFVSLLNCSCEHTIPDILPTTDEHILTDFKTRFPSADIVDISNWSDGKTDICFTDADGLDGVAVYIRYPERLPEHILVLVSKTKITIAITSMSSRSPETVLTRNNMSSTASLHLSMVPKKSTICNMILSLMKTGRF